MRRALLIMLMGLMPAGAFAFSWIKSPPRDGFRYLLTDSGDDFPGYTDGMADNDHSRAMCLYLLQERVREGWPRGGLVRCLIKPWPIS